MSSQEIHQPNDIVLEQSILRRLEQRLIETEKIFVKPNLGLSEANEHWLALVELIEEAKQARLDLEKIPNFSQRYSDIRHTVVYVTIADSIAAAAEAQRQHLLPDAVISYVDIALGWLEHYGEILTPEERVKFNQQIRQFIA